MVRLCAEAGAALVPQGGNTGLAGGAVPDGSATQVVLSLARMNAIRGVDPVGLTLTAEAGCVLKLAQDAAEAAGRLLPVSFAAEGSALVGGVVATNAGGINVVRYGMTRGLVLGLEVVLADGSIVDGLRALRKDNAGYDWKQLFIGTEGTLGIVTAAVLRLVPKPRHTATALLAVPDPAAALRLFTLAQEEIGDSIQAFELISGTSLALVETHAGLKSPVGTAGWTVLIEAASSLSGLREAMEGVLGTALEREDALDGCWPNPAARPPSSGPCASTSPSARRARARASSTTSRCRSPRSRPSSTRPAGSWRRAPPAPASTPSATWATATSTTTS